MWGIEMARELKKYPYVLYYRTGDYQTLDLLKSDITKIEEALVMGTLFASISVGILWLTDFRSILERIDPPAVEEKIEEEVVYPSMSLEDQAYLYDELQKEMMAKKKEADYQ